MNSTEQDWAYARDLADKLEDAIAKGEEHTSHAANLIRHVRRITPTPRRKSA